MNTTVDDSTLIPLPGPICAEPRTHEEVLAWIEVQRRLIRLRVVQREAIDQLTLHHDALANLVEVALSDASSLHRLDVLEEFILDEWNSLTH